MRTVAVFGFLAVSAGVVACSEYTNLGDFAGAGSAGEGVTDDEHNTSGGKEGSSNEPDGGVHYGGSPGSTQGGATSSGGTESGGTESGGTESGGADSSEAGSGTTAGTEGNPVVGPYAPRSGSFKMLAYSATKGFRHDDSIRSGQMMLQQIAMEQGFELTVTEANTDITPAGLAKYEIVFFMNPTGDIFTDVEQEAFEEWMTQKNGAFAGTHSATDTEYNWAFYKEVTGQYYDHHEACCASASIEWDPAQTDFIAVKGLPSPWQRREEWFNFYSAESWTAKPGFKVLGRVTTPTGGTRPVSFIREWGNFRAFYTSIGHEAVAFHDANVKQHIAAGIMWAVRREALFK
jgi:hypothetical protein